MARSGWDWGLSLDLGRVSDRVIFRVRVSARAIVSVRFRVTA